MDTLMSKDQTLARDAQRRPLPALTKWLLATLAAVVILLIYLQVFVVGSFFPPVAPILGLPAVIVALLIYASHRPWTPLFGVIYWILLMGINRSHIAHDIAHPEFLNVFAFTVIILALTVVGIVAGIGATIQNYRARRAGEMEDKALPVPIWFPAILWLLNGGHPHRRTLGIWLG